MTDDLERFKKMPNSEHQKILFEKIERVVFRKIIEK